MSAIEEFREAVRPRYTTGAPGSELSRSAAARHYAGETFDALLNAALAEAWEMGRDDGLDDLGATQTAIDYGELTNPFETN